MTTAASGPRAGARSYTPSELVARLLDAFAADPAQPLTYPVLARRTGLPVRVTGSAVGIARSCGFLDIRAVPPPRGAGRAAVPSAVGRRWIEDHPVLADSIRCLGGR